MATPPIAGGLEAQVVLQANTAFSRDAVVNTFHFDRSGSSVPLATVLPLVRDALIAFYNTAPTGISANPLAYWISSLMDRSANVSKIKIYDLSASAPRVPTTYSFTLGTFASGDAGLPTEVSCCLSMKTAMPVREQRGRIYAGPLVSQAVNLDPPYIHVAGGLINTLRYAGANLRDAANPTAGMPALAIYSRKLNQMHAVTNFWVDNEFDTQRRRGRRATTRSTT